MSGAGRACKTSTTSVALIPLIGSGYDLMLNTTRLGLFLRGWELGAVPSCKMQRLRSVRTRALRGISKVLRLLTELGAKYVLHDLKLNTRLNAHPDTRSSQSGTIFEASIRTHACINEHMYTTWVSSRGTGLSSGDIIHPNYRNDHEPPPLDHYSRQPPSYSIPPPRIISCRSFVPVETSY